MENLGYFEQLWMKTFIFVDVHYNIVLAYFWFTHFFIIRINFYILKCYNLKV